MSDEYIDPSRETFLELKALPQEHPVDMLNLVRLRERAAYTDGRDSSGRAAYAEYGRASQPVFRRVGGEIIWSAEPQFIVIGPRDELWDVAFVARYPSGQAFLDMVYDPEYRAIVHHRQAAVSTSRLVRMRTKEAGPGFA